MFSSRNSIKDTNKDAATPKSANFFPTPSKTLFFPFCYPHFKVGGAMATAQKAHAMIAMCAEEPIEACTEGSHQNRKREGEKHRRRRS